MEERKPELLVSACLCGVACRYDGRHSLVPELAALHARGLALAVCPEVDGGLPTPRPPCELRAGRAVAANDEDFTAHYQAGARRALESARAHGIRLAVLKSKSPSCGSGRVYDGSFSGRLRPGNGLAAALLLENGVQVLDEREFLARAKELCVNWG